MSQVPESSEGVSGHSLDLVIFNEPVKRTTFYICFMDQPTFQIEFSIYNKLQFGHQGAADEHRSENRMLLSDYVKMCRFKLQIFLQVLQMWKA